MDVRGGGLMAVVAVVESLAGNGVYLRVKHSVCNTVIACHGRGHT